MNYKTKSAKVCRVMCRLNFKAALYESICLYGFVGMCATCATYSIKLFNKRITAPVGSEAIGVANLNSITKLRNLAAQVARATQITKHQEGI